MPESKLKLPGGEAWRGADDHESRFAKPSGLQSKPVKKILTVTLRAQFAGRRLRILLECIGLAQI
jgi:hypothetical protein